MKSYLKWDWMNVGLYKNMCNSFVYGVSAIILFLPVLANRKSLPSGQGRLLKTKIITTGKQLKWVIRGRSKGCFQARHIYTFDCFGYTYGLHKPVIFS